MFQYIKIFISDNHYQIKVKVGKIIPIIVTLINFVSFLLDNLTFFIENYKKCLY